MMNSDMMQAFNRLLDPLRRKIAQQLVKGLVLLTDDDMPTQRVQAQIHDQQQGYDQVDHHQSYGFSSRTHKGALGILATIMGSRAHTILLVNSDRRFRITGLQEGEVCVYDDLGNYVHLGREQLIVEAVTEAVVTAPIVTLTATTKVDINAPEINIAGLDDLPAVLTINGVAYTAHTHAGGTLGGGLTGPVTP